MLLFAFRIQVYIASIISLWSKFKVYSSGRSQTSEFVHPKLTCWEYGSILRPERDGASIPTVGTLGEYGISPLRGNYVRNCVLTSAYTLTIGLGTYFLK